MFERGVAVVGLGYIGLPTSAVLASNAVRVTGVDVNPAAVEAINAGRVHIVEPDLDAAVAVAVESGWLRAQGEMPQADAFLIAVPTPFKVGNRPDLSFVEQAARSVARRLTGGEVVILESTCPPGATAQVSAWIAEERLDLRLPHEHPDDPDVFVAHCPERVLPGHVMTELITNDRVVGGLTPECAEKAAELYRLFVQGQIICTDATSAEMAKLVENSFRDVNIAFANELASVCDHLGLDVWEIIGLANQHPRVNVLRPGPGVGGHCIAVDPWFIVSAAPEQSVLIRAAREINDARPAQTVSSVSDIAADGATVACLGIAFKADIDDLRESPALEVTRELALKRPDLSVLVVEPHTQLLPQQLGALDSIELTDLDQALERADVVVLLVDHADFRGLDRSRLAGKQVLDTRGIWR
jgi:UDP-N-acetyl-D-mannosaminuronic acid dehydrogenase